MADEIERGWRERYDQAKLRDDVDFDTLSSEPLEPLYRPDGEIDPNLGVPGEYPYTRGIYPSMYRGRLWTMRQFAGFGSPEQTNERFHFLVEHARRGSRSPSTCPPSWAAIPTTRTASERWDAAA